MSLRAEPTKQKTRRPERRGITRAVSPKKMGKRKKGMSKLRNVGEKEDPDSGSVRFEGHNRRRSGSLNTSKHRPRLTRLMEWARLLPAQGAHPVRGKGSAHPLRDNGRYGPSFSLICADSRHAMKGDSHVS